MIVSSLHACRYRLQIALITSLAAAVLSLQLVTVSGSRNTVLVKSWEDIQKNFTVSLQAETDLVVKPEENIVFVHYIHHPIVPLPVPCRLTKMVKNSSHISVMINGAMETNAKLLTAGMVNNYKCVSSVIMSGAKSYSDPRHLLWTCSSPRIL